MDDYHLDKIVKKLKFLLYLIILGKIKTYNSFLNGYLLCNDFLKIQELMHFWIHNEFT
jgi:hypothetical protein